jgi:hypothetical protein
MFNALALMHNIVEKMQPTERTYFILALMEMIKPFKWVNALLPVLPTAFRNCVMSPTPYIVGGDCLVD